MAQTTNHLIKIAQLEYQKGHFVEASISAKKAAQECLSQKNFSDWLEAARILLLANHELESMLEFEAILTPLQQFEQDSEGATKASAQYLLAHYLLLKNSPEAET